MPLEAPVTRHRKSDDSIHVVVLVFVGVFVLGLHQVLTARLARVVDVELFRRHHSSLRLRVVYVVCDSGWLHPKRSNRVSRP